MQKILSAFQLREADQFTVLHEPIASIDLMERAATACTNFLRRRFSENTVYRIFCGPGNNGGDGLAIARQLIEHGNTVYTYSMGSTTPFSEDRTFNLNRLLRLPNSSHSESSETTGWPSAAENEVWIDALFGTGLQRPLEGLYKKWVECMNESCATRVAIDLPSGFMADSFPTTGAVVFKANITLSFHSPKLTFFLAESAEVVGEWHILNIGLKEVSQVKRWVLHQEDVKQRFYIRKRFSHKGTYGHGLLIAGSNGKYGAAVLAARACLRSGIGLLTVHVPAGARNILQLGAPEAMLYVDDYEDHLTMVQFEISRHQAIGVGPGIGTHEDTVALLHHLIQVGKPLVLDADALNILAMNKEWIDKIPAGSILTPHPKEFERLTRPVQDSVERLELLTTFAMRHQLTVILKGAYSCIAMPDGRLFFNTTGNAGLARGGSGDVLTGIVLAFLSQGYTSEDAALIAVWLHGAAADRVAASTSMQGMLPSDVIEALPLLFGELERS